MLYGSVGRVGLRSSIAPFSPAALFAAGEVGGWYDPSDLTTLFQDVVGTTPVTAVEQPVGLVLDKSKGGTPSARLNRAIYSEAFSTSWGSSNLTLLSGQGDPNGGTSAFRLEANSSIGLAQLFLGTTLANVLFVSGQQTVSLYAKAGTASFITISTFDGVIRSENYFNVSTGERGTINQSGGSGEISPVGNGWYRCSVTYTPASAPVYYAFAICDANNSTSITAGRHAFVFGFDARAGVLGTYQKITTGVNGEWVPGNHLSQSTSTARPVLSARVNLLTYTEDFSNAIWVKSNCTASAMNVADPVGGNTASTITATTASGFFYHNASSATTTVSNSVWVRRRTGTGAIRFRTAAGGTDTDYSSSITSSWSLLTWQCTPSGSANTFVISLATSGDAIDIWHPDCRPSNAGVGLPAYQRVGAATAGSSTAAGNADYDTTGFPYYLKFDGTDDFLVSGTIDPGSVDKAQVFAGVRKLSDAAVGSVLEASPNYTVAGGIGVFAPDNAASARYAFAMTGATGAQFDSTPASYAAPVTSVLQSSMDISQLGYAGLTARVNGAAVALSYTGAGVTSAGNFGSYTIYIGRRGGTTLPYNGQLYSLILRFSATNMDAATISSTETWVNQKTLAY